MQWSTPTKLPRQSVKIHQVCASTADVEQATTEAPQRQQLSTAAEAESGQQRTTEQIVSVLDEAGTSSRQRTAE